MPFNTHLTLCLCCLLFVGCKSGKKSTLDFADGSYDGEINHDGQKHGFGIYRWSDGSIFEGNFENDLRHGKGKFLWSNGESYDGDYLQDQRTGKGIYSWSDGSHYSGDFISGKRHGYGTFSSSSGSVYQGDWFDDMQHGKGKLNRTDGTIIQGIWRRGILLSKPAILPPLSSKPQIADRRTPNISAKMPVVTQIEKPKVPQETESNQSSSTHQNSDESQATPLTFANKADQGIVPTTPLITADISTSQETHYLEPDLNTTSKVDSKAENEPNVPDWIGTVAEAEIFFKTALVEGIDTIHYRSSDLPFTGRMRITDDRGQPQGEVNLLNGRLHGEEIFFDVKGEITERNFWADGRPIGQ